MAQQAPVYSSRYEIVRPLARGGMADVYLARDQLLDRPVALKVLFPELSVDRSFVERFRREAQAAASLSHPNIVSVFDYGEESGSSYIVMEYIQGRTLTQLIRGEGPLLPDRAAGIGADMAAALAFAHRAGVVHRDVKPGNVLIDADGHVKVTDFGIARAANAKENLTQTGAVMGTATYFSPEQAEGVAVDARSDVYSLGVVLYEMVTGRPPFEGDNPVSIAYQHAREHPRPPRSVNPQVPVPFENIVLLALAKRREERYQSAEDLRADLLRFQRGREVAATPPPPTTLAAPVTQAVAATTVQEAADRTRMVAAGAGPPSRGPNRTGAYIALLLLMLAFLAGLLYLFGRTIGLFGATSTAQVDLPSVIGQPFDQARADLEARGLKVKPPDFEANDADPNTVFDQDPKGGQKVDRGSEVTLRVSSGPHPIRVPNVVGETEATARDLLQSAGFTVKSSPATDLQTPAGRVIRQDPAGNSQAARGTTINITVSSGKPQVQVPDDLVGKSVDEAFAELRNAGLNPRQVNEPSNAPQGSVTRTDPAGAKTVDQGSTVTVYVSTGPSTTTTAAPATTVFTSTTTSSSTSTRGHTSTTTTPTTGTP